MGCKERAVGSVREDSFFYLLFLCPMDEIRLLLDQCFLHALHVRNLSPLYISSVRLSCRMYFEHAQVIKLSQCTRDSVEAWLLDGRANRNWSPATYRSYHRNV